MATIRFKKLIHSLIGDYFYNEIRFHKIIFDYNFGKRYEIVRILPNLINEGDYCFDIGANIGQYTLPLSKLVGKLGKVFSFEPVIENYYYLKKMIKKKNLKNVKAFNIALSDRTGTDKIFIPRIGKLKMGTRAFLSNIKVGLKYNDIVKEKIYVKTIDNIVKEMEIDALQLLKCDAEGSELKILKGGYNTIRTHKPILILEINYENKGLDELYNFGYEPFYAIKNKLMGARTSNSKKMSLILIHKEKNIFFKTSFVLSVSS